MSFDSDVSKPKLVEKKIVKFFKNKINTKTNISSNSTESYFTYFFNFIKDFAKENYGFVILITLITLLLYIRYIEVSNRKNIKKKLMQSQQKISSTRLDKIQE